MGNSITVLIEVFNEEKNIKDCIESAYWLSKKIIVVDMESTDKTVKIAKNLGAKIYFFPHSSYVEPARKFGIEKVDTEWVFILDADERLTKELAEEIKTKIKTNKYTYYKVPRKNIFGKIKWLRYGGWWPDYQIRLIKKSALIDWPKEIHSTPSIKGKGGTLSNPLLHYFHGDLEKMVEKTIIFEAIEADLLFKAGKKSNVFVFFRKFLGELWRRLFKNLGFLDGELGIIESIYQAFSKTITYLFLYEKKIEKSRSL